MSVRLDSGQMGVPVRPAAPSLELPSETGLRLCSDSRRWALPGRLTLIATKRLLDTASVAGSNGSCGRYCGHRASAAQLALPTASPSLGPVLPIPYLA